MKSKNLVYIKYIVHVLMKQKFTLSLLLLNSMWHYWKIYNPPPQDFFPASTELKEQNASIQVVSES